MVLVDYCKAFGMVDHGLLLDKLKLYGVGGETIKWLQSYLADRHQLVYLGGCFSDMALMKHGVPQGSILGPLFFTVFINNLPLHVGSSEIDLYANGINNDTWARVDMEFLFECLTRWLTRERSERVRCRVEHEKRNSISTSNHVLFCLSYKHNSTLLWGKADFINEWK